MMEGPSTIKKPLWITHLRQGQQLEMIVLSTRMYILKLSSRADLEASTVAQEMIQGLLVPRIGFLGLKVPRATGRSKSRNRCHQVRTLTMKRKVSGRHVLGFRNSIWILRFGISC